MNYYSIIYAILTFGVLCVGKGECIGEHIAGRTVKMPLNKSLIKL